MTRASIAIAIVGLGQQGLRHLAALQRLAAEHSIRLAGLVDTDPRRRIEMPDALFHCCADDLSPRIDACIIATPTPTHLHVAGALLRRGFDVLVEKPVAANLAQTRALVEIAERHRRIFQVGYLERHHPAYLRERPEFSSPGHVVTARSTVRDSIQSLPDLVRELMIHDLDMLATWLDRDPIDVAWRHVHRDARQVSGVLELSFEGGHRAELTAKSGADKVVRQTRVHCGSRSWLFDWSNGGDSGPGFDPLSRQLIAFADAVRTRTPPLCDGQSALKAMRLAERAIDALPVAA